MKRTLTLLILLASANIVFAQDTTGISKRVNVKVAERGSDHLMIQYGYDRWSGAPDSINIKGSSRHFNVYFLFDKPFKTSPKLSVAYGVGIGSSNMFFNGMYVDIKANAATLPFRRVDTLDHFKKYKLTTIYAEAPIELRYSSNPAEPNSSFKFAIGAKVGTMLKAFTKGKDLQNRNGASLYGNRYIVKESEKKYFNGTKLALTGRIGYGIFSLHADYQVTQLLKENAGPEIRPWAIGLTISGL
jgi:hypothetical protein